VFPADRALKPGERILEQRRAVTVANGNPLPERDRRDTAGEVLGQLLLTLGEDADAELARPAQQFVQGGLLPDRDPDERRLQRERDERRDREAEPLAFEIHRDHRDGRGDEPHDVPQLVAADHGGKYVGPGYLPLQRGSPSEFSSSFAVWSTVWSKGPGASDCQNMSGVTPGPITVAR
jgi:hypothetical protein